MKHRNFILTLALAISSAALTANASAQGKTRAEVRQELIDAFALHIHAAYGLTRINHAARDLKYQ